MIGVDNKMKFNKMKFNIEALNTFEFWKFIFRWNKKEFELYWKAGVRYDELWGYYGLEILLIRYKNKKIKSGLGKF